MITKRRAWLWSRLCGSYKHTQLALSKTYVVGTGDAAENRGHTVQLRLTCAPLLEALGGDPAQAADLHTCGVVAGQIGFYGTWHVRHERADGSCFHDDAEMCLWLPPEPVVIGYKLTISHTVSTATQQLATDYDGDGTADQLATTSSQTVSTTTTKQALYGRRLRNPLGPKRSKKLAPQMAQPVDEVAL